MHFSVAMRLSPVSPATLRIWSLIVLAPLPTATSTQEAAASEGPTSSPGGDYAVETYTYEFPYREIFGKSKHKVGDFARVVHHVGAISNRSDGSSWKAGRKLWIEIATADAGTLRLDAKLVERGTAEDTATFLDEVFEELLDTQLGWEVSLQRSAKGTLGMSDEPGVSWQFVMDVSEPDKDSSSLTATLVQGERRLDFLEEGCNGNQAYPGQGLCIAAYEEGRWLGHGDNREYVFREGLDPGLKLLVLGGIEAVKISVKFHDSLH